MEYYSTIKRNETSIHVTTQTNFRRTMLSKGGQTKYKHAIYMLKLT